MNKIKIITLLSLTSLLAIGCSDNNSGQSIYPSESTNISSNTTSQTSCTSDSEFISASESSEEITSQSSDSESTLSEDTSSEEPKSALIDFYSVNDLHGRILGHTESDPNIAKLQTLLKEKKSLNPENFVFTNSGDLFQDTYESGVNYGNLLAETLPVMECEAMAIGNHEFDWGTDRLIANRELADPCTFLGANIYHFDENTNKVTDFASELGDKYKIIERSGLKIGLIGIIGYEQITSIMSKIVEGYTFLEPRDIVCGLSDYLKGEQGCDAVVVLAHADLDGLNINNSNFAKTTTSKSPVTNKRYIDACFTAHSHQDQFDMVNNVPFIQAGCHGERLAHIQMELTDGEEAKITYARRSEYIDYASLEPDQEIQDIIDKYLTKEVTDRRDEVVTHFTYGGAPSEYILRGTTGNISAKTTYDMMVEAPDFPKDVNIDIVINNGGRNKAYLLENGGVSRGALFNGIPFTNKTYVAKIKGADILSQLRWKSNCFYAPKEVIVNSNDYYTVATTDYMLFHKNSNREYDRFSNYDGNIIYCEERTPYDLMADYFLAHPEVKSYELKEFDKSVKEFSSNIRTGA